MFSKVQRARTQRLRRELLDLQTNPVENCSAFPVEDNISLWHANIYSPVFDATFHFEITYPASYPEKAPKVKNLTEIKHTNVFGSYICLDILTMSEETANTPFRGWTSAYTISSLLVQLQCFLFDVKAETSGYKAQSQTRMVHAANRFSCRTCGHGPKNVFPVIQCLNKGRTHEPTRLSCKVVKKAATLVEDEEISFLEEVPDIVLNCICTLSDQETLTKLQSLTDRPIKAIDRVLMKKTYKCFYTLKDLNDERIVLGLGAKKDIMARRSRKTRRKTVQLQRLHCSFDYMSHEAYQLGVRNNIWKDRDFDSFIPLFINTQHSKRSLPVAEKCLLEMWQDDELTVKATVLTPPIILNTLSKLMNTTIVNMMKTVEDLECGELQLFDSIKAIEGYVSFHHLLLGFIEKYPLIKTLANERVRKFIEIPAYRDKEITPDIGELLVDLSISDYSWDDFCPKWLEEAFTRNARWICSSYPNLLQLNEKSSCVRLTQSWKATRTGRRLAMFQRFFISEISCPERLVNNPKKCAILLQEYNDRLGLPPHGMAEKLQGHSRDILSCDNWFEYFTLIDFCPPCVPRLDAWLRNAILISERKDYHSSKMIYRYAENWKEKPQNTHQMDPRNCICTGHLFRIPDSKCKIASSATLMKKKTTGIDICFVLDCTGSMGSWIGAAKKEICNIIKTVSKQCEGKVRFASVGYRDHHSKGHKGDEYVVKGFNFTSSAKKAKTYVEGYSAHGGADYPEAMCVGMQEAYNMAWNRESHQIVVLIADAPPHGLGARGDDYPDGSPDGEDSIRIAHTMAKAGIVIYPVDCARGSDATRETFFHAIASITGGYALSMTDSKLLPEIVLGAAREEQAMDALGQEIQPIWDDAIKSLPQARFEQYCLSVYSQLNYDGYKIKSVLPADNYDKTIQHQVDCLTFCTDMKQAKAMVESEYFIPIYRTTKLESSSKRPVTQAQVTKCMKRMKDKMEEMRFMKDGCAYKNANRFKSNVFKIRWTEFKAQRGIANLKLFRPWKTLQESELRNYEEIPDSRRLKKDDMKAIARGMKNGLIDDKMIGSTIEVELDGEWKKLKILKRYRKNTFLCDDDGFDLVIPEDCKWKRMPEKSKWGKKPAVAKPAPVPTPKKETTAQIVEAPVVKDEAPVAVPEVKKEEALVVAPSPVQNVPAVPSRSATPSERSVSRTRECPFEIGQVVNVRNNESEIWILASVTQISPCFKAQPIVGAHGSAVFAMVAPARSRKFITKNPTVVARNGVEDIPMEAETLIEVVTIDRFWAYIVSPHQGWIVAKNTHTNEKEIRLAPELSAAPVVEPVAPTHAISPFGINQVVSVRNSDSEAWKIGTVVQNQPAVVVHVQGETDPEAYAQIAPAPTREFVLTDDTGMIYQNLTTKPVIGMLTKNDCFEVVEFFGPWAHIVSPMNGWLLGKKQNGTKTIARAPAPSPRPATPTVEAPEVTKTIEKEVSLILIVNDVPRTISASKVAQLCQMQGGMPLGVGIFEDAGRRFARITFDDETMVNNVYSKGLVFQGVPLMIQYSL